jgi:hypothetical protein
MVPVPWQLMETFEPMLGAMTTQTNAGQARHPSAQRSHGIARALVSERQSSAERTDSQVDALAFDVLVAFTSAYHFVLFDGGNNRHFAVDDGQVLTSHLSAVHSGTQQTAVSSSCMLTSAARGGVLQVVCDGAPNRLPVACQQLYSAVPVAYR